MQEVASSILASPLFFPALGDSSSGMILASGARGSRVRFSHHPVFVLETNKRSWSSGYDRRLPSDGPGFNSRRAHFFSQAVLAEWLRRMLKAHVRKSVGSIPTDCIFFSSRFYSVIG